MTALKGNVKNQSKLVAAIKAKLREKNGDGLFMAVAIVWAALFLLLILAVFIHLHTMVMGISDFTQQAILQTAASNAYNAYNGVREGNSSAHNYAGEGAWNEMVTTAEVMRRLEDTLDLERRGNSLYKYDGGTLKYAITDIEIHCTNVPVGSASNNIRLTFYTTVTAVIPVRFMGANVDIEKTIKLTSYYTPRF